MLKHEERGSSDKDYILGYRGVCGTVGFTSSRPETYRKELASIGEAEHLQDIVGSRTRFARMRGKGGHEQWSVTNGDEGLAVGFKITANANDCPGTELCNAARRRRVETVRLQAPMGRPQPRTHQYQAQNIQYLRELTRHSRYSREPPCRCAQL